MSTGPEERKAIPLIGECFKPLVPHELNQVGTQGMRQMPQSMQTLESQGLKMLEVARLDQSGVLGEKWRKDTCATQCLSVAESSEPEGF